MVKYRAELNKIIDLSKPVAELGCAEGNFSRDMLEWGVELYMVDLWDTIPGQRGDGGYEKEWHEKNYQEAMKKVAKYGDRVHVLRGMTAEMAKYVEDESLGLLYLDADHSYDGVMRDLEAWWPKLSKGGYCSSHDYLSGEYGVQQAVKDFTRRHKIFEVLTIPENKAVDAGCLFRKPL